MEEEEQPGGPGKELAAGRQVTCSFMNFENCLAKHCHLSEARFKNQC